MQITILSIVLFCHALHRLRRGRCVLIRVFFYRAIPLSMLLSQLHRVVPCSCLGRKKKQKGKAEKTVVFSLHDLLTKWNNRTKLVCIYVHDVDSCNNSYKVAWCWYRAVWIEYTLDFSRLGFYINNLSVRFHTVVANRFILHEQYVVFTNGHVAFSRDDLLT